MTTSKTEEQGERREIIANDSRVRKDTFASRASAEADLENVGRHAKPSTIVGGDAAVEYPELPAGAMEQSKRSGVR